MKLKTTLAVLGVALTSLSSYADTTIPVTTSYETVCSISGQPTSIDFVDVQVGVANSVDFTVNVLCNFANTTDEVAITIPPLDGVSGGSVVFTEMGFAAGEGTVMFDQPAYTITSPSVGEQSLAFVFSAHLVENPFSYAPVTNAHDVSGNADVFLSVTPVE